MSRKLADLMLSYARSCRKSIHAYNALERQYPSMKGKYAVRKRDLLRSACFYIRWARDEYERAEHSRFKEAA